jgi:Regulator of polyketide synthase expression
VTEDELTPLLSWVEARLPRLIDDVDATVTEQIAIYRDAAHVPPDELHHSIENNLKFLVTALRHPQSPLDLSVPQGTGRRRAHQAVPLPEVLQVYRIGFATLWDALVERARHGSSPAAISNLLATSTLVWKITEEHATAVTEAYRAATAELLIAQQHRRAALVEVLLTGHLGRNAGPWEAAALLGFPPDADLAVVAAQTRDVAEESLPGIERILAAHGIVSGWRLTPSLQLGVVSLRASQREALLDELRGVAKARTGVSPLFEAPGDTPRALRLARAALGQIPVSSVEVRMFSSSPIAALMASEPDEGRRLAERVLGPVLKLPAEDRTTLLGTLDAYLDHSGSSREAAEVLHCHPNTVRYRLRHLQELTGLSLADPNDVAELAAAAYAIRMGNEPQAPLVPSTRVR